MWEITGNISINGIIQLHCDKIKESLASLGYNEGVKIKFSHMLPLSNEKREVVHFMKKFLEKKENTDINWVIPNYKKWEFDLDKIKKKIPDLSSIEWLTGKVFLEPDIFVDPNEKVGSKGTNITFYITKDTVRRLSIYIKPPSEIEGSIKGFQEDYPITSHTAFIMMRYGESKAHNNILKTIKKTLENLGIKGVVAKDKEYHDDLYYNILTYIFSCNFGIAVFERINQEEFNPNVSFEVGYMKALNKHVCLLKDTTLKSLQTDIIGKIYQQFDTRNPEETIPEVLVKWMKDKDIVEG